MADRQTIIDAVTGYVVEAQRAQAAALVGRLVDTAVTSFGAEFRWRYRLKRKSDYVVSSSSSYQYTFPNDFRSTHVMGSFTNGLLDLEFFKISQEQFAANKTSLAEDGVTRYVEIPPANNLDPWKFILVNAPEAGATFVLDYHRMPLKADITLIDSDVVLIYRVLMALPPQYLISPGNYIQLYQYELQKLIADEKTMSAAPQLFRDNPMTENANLLIAGLTQ